MLLYILRWCRISCINSTFHETSLMKASLPLKNGWMEDKTQGLPFGGPKCASELLAFGMSFLGGVGLFARKI